MTHLERVRAAACVIMEETPGGFDNYWEFGERAGILVASAVMVHLGVLTQSDADAAIAEYDEWQSHEDERQRAEWQKRESERRASLTQKERDFEDLVNDFSEKSQQLIAAQIMSGFERDVKIVESLDGVKLYPPDAE